MESSRTLWVVLSVLLLGIIAGFVCGNRAIKYLEKDGGIHDVSGTPSGPDANGVYL